VAKTAVTRHVHRFLFHFPACAKTHLPFLMAAKRGSHPAPSYSPVFLYSEYDRSEIMSRDGYNLNPLVYTIGQDKNVKKEKRFCRSLNHGHTGRCCSGFPVAAILFSPPFRFFPPGLSFVSGETGLLFSQRLSGCRILTTGPSCFSLAHALIVHSLLRASIGSMFEARHAG